MMGGMNERRDGELTGEALLREETVDTVVVVVVVCRGQRLQFGDGERVEESQSGWKEERNPSRLFNTSSYLKYLKNIYEIEINPLYHYIIFGKKEGVSPHGEINNLIYSIGSQSEQGYCI